MTQRNTEQFGDQLAAKLRAFFETLEPEEKIAMARFLSAPTGAEDVAGYSQDVAEFGNPLTVQSAEGLLQVITVDLFGFVTNVASAEASTEAITSPEAAEGSARFETP